MRKILLSRPAFFVYGAAIVAIPGYYLLGLLGQAVDPAGWNE